MMLFLQLADVASNGNVTAAPPDFVRHPAAASAAQVPVSSSRGAAVVAVEFHVAASVARYPASVDHNLRCFIEFCC